MTAVWQEQLLPGPAGLLQARALWRSGATRLAVVCHPHPQMGGSMDNKVVTTLGRYFRDRQPPQSVLLFNYRGVGQSTGTYADGVGELADLQRAAQFRIQPASADEHPAGGVDGQIKAEGAACPRRRGAADGVQQPGPPTGFAYRGGFVDMLQPFQHPGAGQSG